MPRYNSSLSLAAWTAAAGLGTTAALLYLAPGTRNDADHPARSSPFSAFLPSSLPPYDPLVKKPNSVISTEQAEAFLLANQRSLNWRTPGSPVLRHDFNSVPSNHPCEDDASYGYIGGKHYFAIFDGHSGFQVSRLLAETLISRIAPALSGTKTDEDVRSALKKAYLELDDELVNSPLKLRDAYEARSYEPYKDDGRWGQPLAERLKQVQAYWRAAAGSCSLVAVCDAAHDRLHVAVTGDSRAVMGTWDPQEKVWRAVALSEDQTSANPKEAARLKALHPPEEAEALTRNGRTLGLGISRAFGDARFKWTEEQLTRASSMVFGNPIKPYKDSKTPPYVSAEPEVVSVPLTPAGGRGFVVLASDGVYDRLSNAEVVGLVGGWLDGRTGPASRAEVLANVKVDEDTSRKAGVEYFPKPYADENPAWHKWGFTFEDANAATHIIRNGVAGDDKEELRVQYSFDAKGAREQRDDMTVYVIFLGEPQGPAAAHAQGQATRRGVN
ncbi:protein serine/threonine phosphatase 2C [Auricularia subglabra TFB-10046 SS5]|nr:protein serine/threonine phosphatase 2C [Auricularia subglabra TFB-10046 SS5]